MTGVQTCALPIWPHGYCGVSRLPDGRVNVCGLFRREALAEGKGHELLFDTITRAELTQLARRFAVSQPLEGTFAAVSGLGYTPPAATDTLCLGDRYGLIPPFTGNGMSLALESAEAALPALVAYGNGNATWEATKATVQAALRHRFRSRLWVARHLHHALLHPLGQGLLAEAARQPLFPFGTLYRLTH